MKNSIDYTLLRNLLTIRYNPNDPTKNKIKKNDFSPFTADETGKKTEHLLKTSIEDFFNSNPKTISISISGGIDSTLALGLIRKSFPDVKIHTFCGIFGDGFDESVIARNISEKFDADFHPVEMASVFTAMPKIISITGKPKWNTYIHYIAKNAKKFSNNFVTGDGADEIFGGYTFRYSKFLNSLKSGDTWNSRVKNYLECHNRDWVPDQHNLFGNSIKFSWNEIYQYFKPYFKNNLKPLNQVFFSDFNGKLVHDFIPLGQTIAKYYNLKSFSPFLSPNVISFGLKLPILQKYNNKTNTGKIVLRKISKRLGIKHLNEKRGFSPSILYDWQKNGKDICNSYILKKDSYIYQQKLINYDWVLNAVEKVENDGNIRYLNRLISILALEIWYRVCVLKEMKSSKLLK